jgi:hypothetical protein
MNYEKNKDMIHTVIEGPPGVGKTTLGYIIGEIYSNLDIIEQPKNNTKSNQLKFKIVKRSDLVAKYLGQTSHRTQEVINSILGGVLFIDEAYSLGNNDVDDSYSKECLDTLNQNLSEKKNQFLCIIAGYKDALERNFFAYNEGLRRRFPFTYTIEEYTSNELKNIFLGMLDDSQWELEEYSIKQKNIFNDINTKQKIEFNYINTKQKIELNIINNIKEEIKKNYKKNKEDYKVNKEDYKEDYKKNKEDVKVNKEDVKVNKEDVKVNKEDVKVNKEEVKVNKEEVKVNKEEVKVNKEEVKVNKEDKIKDDKIKDDKIKDEDVKEEEDIKDKIKKEDLLLNFFEKNKQYFPNFGGDIETLIFQSKIEHCKRVFFKNEEEHRKLTLEDINNGLEVLKQHKKIKEKDDYKLLSIYL